MTFATFFSVLMYVLLFTCVLEFNLANHKYDLIKVEFCCIFEIVDRLILPQVGTRMEYMTMKNDIARSLEHSLSICVVWLEAGFHTITLWDLISSWCHTPSFLILTIIFASNSISVMFS